jgi:hypothetical protein
VDTIKRLTFRHLDRRAGHQCSKGSGMMANGAQRRTEPALMLPSALRVENV